ncbi:MAG: 2,3-dihydroxyphenylpropionate 1,2-dioxygenase [Pseudomonadota bacterium]|nr:2,3-dihydroxyphenylpropionate 1,2-dioxygenase [Pseudomonadota bacterium]
MATVVGTISLSHSPLWNLKPDPGANEPGGSFVSDVDKARDLVARLKPDVIVLFGPDHARGVFYDMLPAFAVGVERLTGIGDYFTPKGELPVAQGLARAIFDGVTARGFDPALSLDMQVDHGLTQVYARLAPALDIPIVPIIINAGCPPMPTFARSFDFGRAVGDAIAQYPGAERVLTVGSGGMSHWPASTNAFDETIAPEWREFLINGRPRVPEMEEGRVAKAMALAEGGATGHVAEDWDRALLQRIMADPTALRHLDSEDVAERAGPGACELRTWAAAVAAWGQPVGWEAYEPVPEWITGMGIVASEAPELEEV